MNYAPTIENLNGLLGKLKSSKCPEDIFGLSAIKATEGLHGTVHEFAVKTSYRDLAKLAHPDQFGGKGRRWTLANVVFAELQRWHVRAKQKIANGTYGDMRPVIEPVTIKTKKGAYTITEHLCSGDLCEIYGGMAGSTEVVVKVARNPVNNDLVSNEGARLHEMWDSPAAKLKVSVHLPQLIDAFELKQTKMKKRVTVLKRLIGYYTLREVHTAHPILDPRDAAWMFNRLLGALLAVHRAGLVHGAVIPAHVLVAPAPPDTNEVHNGVLIDWSYAVSTGSPLKAIAPSWKPFYPKEVFDKAPTGPFTDIYMAAMCYLYLLGGDVEKRTLPVTVPTALKGMVRACLLGPKHRPSDAFEFHNEFNDTLKNLYGPKKFRKLSMP